MKIPHGYQRYHGFCITLCELRFGYGYTRDGLRCVQVRVGYGKIPPTVYPCSTLLTIKAICKLLSLATLVETFKGVVPSCSIYFIHSLHFQTNIISRGQCNRSAPKLVAVWTQKTLTGKMTQMLMKTQPMTSSQVAIGQKNMKDSVIT